MKIIYKTKTHAMVMTAVFTALTAVLSLITIPLPSGIPVTLQTFAIALCGFVLGAKMGLISTVLYLALGIVGLPVFSGFSSGFGQLLGVTGGFLWGFLIMVVLCGLGAQGHNKLINILLGLAGLAICHLCGLWQFSNVASTSLAAAFFTATAPYIIKDIISLVLALFVANIIKVSLGKAGLVAIKAEEINNQ